MAKEETSTPAPTPEPTTDVAISRARNTSTLSVVERMAMLSNGSGIVSTLEGNTLIERKATLNAVTNASPISEHLGQTINLVHVVAQQVTIVDTATGEANDAIRAILLDADGSAYAATSDGIMGSLRDVFGIMGQPSTWPEPLPIRVVEKRGRQGFRFYKIELV
jgi:Phage Single-stranded DNA-binding protein